MLGPLNCGDWTKHFPATQIRRATIARPTPSNNGSYNHVKVTLDELLKNQHNLQSLVDGIEQEVEYEDEENDDALEAQPLAPKLLEALKKWVKLSLSLCM
ncbi:hypothetical protein P8452_17458 [Trifolium repens]|nr:hypothetical protein P8452_17458 [Trifolium repens]